MRVSRIFSFPVLLPTYILCVLGDVVASRFGQKQQASATLLFRFDLGDPEAEPGDVPVYTFTVLRPDKPPEYQDVYSRHQARQCIRRHPELSGFTNLRLRCVIRLSTLPGP